MTKKLMLLLIMYHEIHRLKREGFKPSWIGRELGLDRRTIKKYLSMEEEEFLDFKHRQQSRKKLLDRYDDYVRQRLEDCPEASSAQVHDWLKENFVDFINMNEKTVFNFVLSIRRKYGIPKPFISRDYEQVEEHPYGKQAQADFGEYNMTTENGKRKKVYFFSMVLSRSRHKYVVFSDSPFNTRTTINAHEKCFQFFQGMPGQLVYDQDTLMLTDENYGDLILTEEFRSYVQHRNFKLRFCRKSDPESKGKIENVIKYIKYNFLRGRKYVDIDILNGQALKWLSRTANAKVHSATKKVPEHEWIIEKSYLNVISSIFQAQQPGKLYSVRKDNTIAYKGNFYALPPGTFRGNETKVMVMIKDDHISIYNAENNQIAHYKIHTGKGKLLGNTNFKRDFSLKIDQFIDQLSCKFSDPTAAKKYLQLVRKSNPRYIRDQLLLLRKMIEKYDIDIMDTVLEFCIQNNILKATDMESLAKKVIAENNGQQTGKQEPIEIKTLNKTVFKIIPEKSNISDYKSLMN